MVWHRAGAGFLGSCQAGAPVKDRDTIIAAALLVLAVGVLVVFQWGSDLLALTGDFATVFDRSPLFWVGVSLGGAGLFAILWRDE